MTVLRSSNNRNMFPDSFESSILILSFRKYYNSKSISSCWCNSKTDYSIGGLEELNQIEISISVEELEEYLLTLKYNRNYSDKCSPNLRLLNILFSFFRNFLTRLFYLAPQAFLNFCLFILHAISHNKKQSSIHKRSFLMMTFTDFIYSMVLNKYRGLEMLFIEIQSYYFHCTVACFK